ncbi:MAG: TrmH family RNA methyltransferase [Burkholderiaceae bacterium]
MSRFAMPTVISSRENPQIKALRRLILEPRVRRAEGRCWVEGPRMVSAALGRFDDSAWVPELLCVAVGADGTVSALHQTMLEASLAQGARICAVEPTVFRSVSDVQADQGIGLVMSRGAVPAATGRRIETPRGDVVVLDGLQDPGNVGTLIRTAAAAGIAQVLLTEGSAEAFSPKALRAGAGAQFGLAITESLGPSEVVNVLSAADASLVLTLAPHASEVVSLYSSAAQTRLSDRRPIAWVFGQEGQGVSSAWTDLGSSSPDRYRLTIPQAAGVESLNVMAAAAVLLFERLRCCREQR